MLSIPALSSISMGDYPKLIAGLQACSEAERRTHCRNLCRTDLYFLLRYGLQRADIEKQWLFDRCREVQTDRFGHLDLWAREHYKSTIITFAGSIQDILRSHGEGALEPECTIGIFSHTRPNAKGFLQQIKRELESNGLLQEWFPDILWENPRRDSPSWSDDGGIIVRRKGNPKEATVEAWGVVDGQPTGKHFSKLKYDDVVTKESVTSPEMMQKTTDALALSYNLGAEGGTVEFIGTRYHFNDTYKTVLERQTVKARIHQATVDGTVDGEPVLLSREVLAKKRRDMGPYIFGCQMLQNPVADETQGFRREWLRQYHDNIEPKETGTLNKYMLVDAANGKRPTNDYTAIWIVGLGADRNYYVLDLIRDRLNLTQRAAAVMRLHRKWRPVETRYEKYGLMADVDYIKTVQQKENYRFDLIEVGGQTPKNDRIKRLIPLFEQGLFYLPITMHRTDYQGRTEDLMQVFVEQEYASFPVGMHDDMMDSLARIAEPDLPLMWPYEEEEATEPEWARDF